MKVKDLIKALENVDPEMIVYCTSGKYDYDYEMVISASVQWIAIEDEDEDGQPVFLIEEK